jgi:hypothetical protein
MKGHIRTYVCTRAAYRIWGYRGGGVIKILKSTRGMQYGSVNVQRLGGGTFLLKVRIILNCE